MVNQNIYTRPMEITAEHIMTEDVETIKPDMLVGDLAHIMLRKGFNGFPVVDNDRLIGIVTFTDLFNLLHGVEYENINNDTNALHQKIIQLKQWPVSKIMTTDVKTVSPTTTLSEIIEYVVIQKIHTFPVISNGKVVGILGREDVLNATFSYG
ncbi:MAG: HPP family protein [Candidatus Omnitrophota bacterium]